MADKHAGYVVVLDESVVAEYAEADPDILTALRMIRGVISVEPVAGDPALLIAQARAERKFKDKLLETFFEREQP